MIVSLKVELVLIFFSLDMVEFLFLLSGRSSTSDPSLGLV